ncbi:MAG TPA: CapA family protein [Leptolyngbyaceae cyanobacterium M65_K2018_010]|nr:CapA family protein [Leptolyngbyaceae cyanobacterium M65_K2018_010]
MRFEVSWRDRTLFVFLTAPHLDHPEAYAALVYAAITPLRLANLTELRVLDGAPQPQLKRWQRSFLLPVVEEFAPTPEADNPSLLSVCPPAEDEAAPAFDPEGGPDSGLEGVALLHEAAIADATEPALEPEIAPDLELDAIALPPPLEGEVSDGDSLAAEITPPTPLPALEEDRPSPRPARSRPPWRWGLLSTLVTLGLGLGAGVTQWRSSQPIESAPRGELARSSLAPAFTPNRLTALVPSTLQAPTTLTINAVGDIIPGTDYQRYRLPQDWQYLFRSIQYQLADADLTFGNFESTLTEVPNSAKDTRRAMTFAFRTPPWYASVLKEAGFDVLSVANNHSFDFGEQGFAETIAHIEAAGMKAVGRKGEILYLKVKETTVAFIGFSHLSQHNTVHDLETAAALVQEAKGNADLVVVSFHAGKEGTDAIYTRDQTEFFFSENRGNVVQFSRTVIDHGADLVLGHGPHVPRAIELYQNKLIAYSLGNFLGYRSLSTQGPLGVSLILTANLNAQGDFVSGRIIPVALDPNGVPYLDDHFQSVVLIRQYTRRDFPQTPLEIDDLGYIRRVN